MDEARAVEILGNGEHGVLSMVALGPDGAPAGYGIPLNYVFEHGRLYFHCAPQGRKLECLGIYPESGFCVVGRTEVQPGKFTTGYESVIATGKVSLVEDESEKMEALKLILRKYSPEFYETGIKYSEASFARVAILRMDIVSLSGKSKNIW